jgi:hypothetical protein
MPHRIVSELILRAEEARTIAEEMRTEAGRSAMLDAAQKWEELARRWSEVDWYAAERISRSQDHPTAASGRL